MMRITDTMRYRQSLDNIARTQRSLQTAQEQVSTGRRVQRPSDDPNAAATVLSARAVVKGVEQFQRNISSAISRVEVEESVLNQLTDALDRVGELAVTAGSDTVTTETRLQVKSEVDNLVRFITGLGNTRMGDVYLFGGHRPDQPPFDPDAPLVPLTSTADLDHEHRVEVAVGERVATNHNGKEVFLDTGAIAVVQELSDALAADDGQAIRGALETLQGVQDRVQGLIGDVGGRYNHLENTQGNLEIVHLSAVKLSSDAEDVDLSKVLIDVANRQTALEAAYLTTSRILSLSLVDYL